MENFDIARNALQTSQNSTGSAMEEHARALDSISGKLNQFKATWESLSQSFISSGFIKGAVDFGTGFLGTIDTLVQKLGSVPTLLTAITAGLSAIKNVGWTINQFTEYAHEAPKGNLNDIQVKPYSNKGLYKEGFRKIG